MDLASFVRALRDQRRLVLTGLGVALLLSVLAGYRVTGEGLAPRAERRYTSVASIFVAGEQGGAFRAVSPRTEAATPGEDPGELADVYAQLVVSDEVRQRVERVYGPLENKNANVAAFRQVARAPRSGVGAGRPRPLPFVEITATAPNPGDARRLAQLTAETFLRFVDEQRDAAGIPPDERVSLELARRGTSARVTGRNPLLLVGILFVGFVGCFLALAIVLHNMSQARRRPGEPVGIEEAPGSGEAPAGPGPAASRESEPTAAPREPEPTPAPREPEPTAAPPVGAGTRATTVAQPPPGTESVAADQARSGAPRARIATPPLTGLSAVPWWQITSVSPVEEPQDQRAVPDASSSGRRGEEPGADSW